MTSRREDRCRSRSGAAALAAGAFLLAAGALGAAQSGGTSKPAEPKQQQPPPVFRTEANFVRVDAYPTADGKPVLDLKAEDFQIFEDGAPQTVSTFEHVVVRPAGPQTMRAEPNTVEASRQLAANPRNRVFVLFLDVQHVTIHGAWTIREPLVKLIDRILGDDDLIGIMTPSMSAADLVLARKTEVVAGGLRDRWPWGERHTLARSERELAYKACYPWKEADALVDEMTDRGRERMTLDALDELVHYLGALRDDRKTILAVTEGWLLYRPNPSLTNRRVDPETGVREPAPGPPPVGVGPDGKPTLDRNRLGSAATQTDCDTDRARLALIDNARYLRDIIEDANRWNASFYSVDPRGLAVWDAPIGPAEPPPLHVDQDNLRKRHDAMIDLANNTDGFAVVNSNNLDAGLKRIADDLTSYYLLGYYSTKAKFDGQYRTLKVAVKRPGVEVRARKGYRAATEDEVLAARAASGPPVPEPAAAVNAVINGLGRSRTDAHLRINASPAPGGAIVWVAGELRNITAAPAGSAEAVADVQISGAASGSSKVALTPGQRSFLLAVTLDKPAISGHLDIKARVSGASVVPYGDNARVQGGAPPRALLYRRGPTTGNKVQPAGEPQFSRTERVQLALPVAAGVTAGAGRVLDRNAQPLTVPIVTGSRVDADTGQAWVTAEVTLAPLTLGDYAVEITLLREGKEERLVTAIRVGR